MVDRLREVTIGFACILTIAVLAAIIPGWVFLVIKFGPVWVPFIEAHLILKVMVILYGIAGGIMLINWAATAIYAWYRNR